MNRERFDTLLAAKAEEIQKEALELSHDLWLHPELSGEEHRSCRVLAERAAAHGFRVTVPFAGMETAFLAEYRMDGGAEGCQGAPGKLPTVAFLAEYDALPGYGELSPDGSGNAHACGHNWISAVSFAAAVSLKEAVEAWNLEAENAGNLEAGNAENAGNAVDAGRAPVAARILLIGTPAEETWGGKIKMADEGFLKELAMDAVFECHLSGIPKHCFENYLLALTDMRYTFLGKASHAAVHPELGINALDALNLMYNGVSCLRQQVLPDTRIHARVQEGGEAVNIIPDRTSVQYYLRSGKRSYLEQLVERVNDCARGAALMTGCRAEIERKPLVFSDMQNNAPLVRRAEEHYLKAAGISGTARREEIFREDSVFTAPSGDIGNASYEAPSFYGVFSTAPESGGADIHDAAYLPVTDSAKAGELLLLAGKTISATAADILTDERFRAAVRGAWEQIS